MTTINLRIQRGAHLTSLQIGHALAAVRITTRMALRTPDGWTQHYPAVIDTGAPVSMLPPRIWRGAKYEEIGRVTAGGIVARDECRIPAVLAVVTCMVSDDVSFLGPLQMHAYLAEPEDVPILLGCSGVLERATLMVDLTGNRATLAGS